MTFAATTISEHYRNEGLNKGLIEGEKKGKNEGLIEGEKKGKIKGKIEMLEEMYRAGILKKKQLEKMAASFKQQLKEIQA
ncbi:MAG: hypothetical protein U9N77_14700, partial [Thermodesulfobacteriota bacterium]|nr:hypothetical protein [Thermodesulfobacteriota bacterium]